MNGVYFMWNTFVIMYFCYWCIIIVVSGTIYVKMGTVLFTNTSLSWSCCKWWERWCCQEYEQEVITQTAWLPDQVTSLAAAMLTCFTTSVKVTATAIPPSTHESKVKRPEILLFSQGNSKDARDRQTVCHLKYFWGLPIQASLLYLFNMNHFRMCPTTNILTDWWVNES